jgi:putative ABC transport system substrate-binding protein
VNRRVFISAVAMSILTVPNGAEAQPAGRVYRLGLLHPTSPSPQDQVMAPTIVKALRELGYVEGQNLTMERRYAEGRVDRLTVLARELVQLRVDVLLAVGSAAIRAAKEATTTIPIVMYGGFDPGAAGFVASLARPGGNVTGVVMGPGSSLTGKRLELLREAVPRVTRVAFLVPDDPNFRPQMEEVQEAATALGIKLLPVEIRGGDYPHAFSMMAGERAAALLVGATPRFVTDRKQIIELAAKHRLPAMYEWPDQVEDGGLMSYGSSQAALLQRVAVLVDRIFKGARPGDLPVEQPTKFELVINRRTAKALGLVLPQSILNRADRTIE